MSGKTDATSKWSAAVPGGQHLLRHGLGFLVSGGLAFLTDLGVLELLVSLLGVHPIPARLGSLSCAHVVGWLSHRRLTFRLTTPPTMEEFLRYAGVQTIITVGINWGIYALIIYLRPSFWHVLAMVVSSGVAMFFSYFGIRFAAFRVGRQ
jgi:putative flippase GtrA